MRIKDNNEPIIDQQMENGVEAECPHMLDIVLLKKQIKMLKEDLENERRKPYQMIRAQEKHMNQLYYELSNLSLQQNEEVYRLENELNEAMWEVDRLRKVAKMKKPLEYTAYILAEKDGFRGQPDQYWTQAHLELNGQVNAAVRQMRHLQELKEQKHQELISTLGRLSGMAEVLDALSSIKSHYIQRSIANYMKKNHKPE